VADKRRAWGLHSRDTQLILLDAHVGEHIFSQAIAGALVRGVTRILVTHHVHLLDRCDRVIVLEGGRVQHYGSYADLVAQGVDFAVAIDVTKAKIAEEAEGDDEQQQQQQPPKEKSGNEERCGRH
jgi:ATP-binding cassette, subfamily C (CFTR/MRP), member 1